MIVEVRQGGLLLTILDNKMSKIIRTSDIKIGNVGGLKLLRLLLEVVREQGGFPDPEAGSILLLSCSVRECQTSRFRQWTSKN